eukprot:3081675-Amphidinium_carterae.1
MKEGTYIDVNGQPKALGGDLTKLRYAKGLSAGAKKILDNLEARSSNIAGTHEIRKKMRYQTHANRVHYGTSVFVTFSPSERDT